MLIKDVVLVSLDGCGTAISILSQRQYHKSSIKLESRGLFISNTFEGSLIETGGSFDLAKTLVSVVHKELERKAENLKYLK